MKVIYITTRPPYPPHKGDQLIAFEQIRNMPKEKHEIYLVSLVSNYSETNEVKNRLGEYCKEIYFIKIDRITQCLSMLKTIVNMKPLQVNMYNNKYIINRIREIQNEVRPDIVHFQTARLGEVLKDLKAPKVLDMIDILSLNMKRRAQRETFFFKIVFMIEAILLEKYEASIINKYKKVTMVSQNDLDNSNLKSCTNIVINPNGTFIDKEYLEQYKDIKKENIILFHGNMNYFPNYEAMDYFVKHIWPDIITKYPDYRLFIVGKDPIDKIANLNNKNNIVVTGFVEDICEYLCKAKIGVYPLNSGTGMQNKILEALACGLPIIASDYALQGIPGITSSEVIVANKKEEYLSAIDNLINSDDVRTRYKVNGQSFIFSRYSWHSNIDRLIKVWEDSLD